MGLCYTVFQKGSATITGGQGGRERDTNTEEELGRLPVCHRPLLVLERNNSEVESGECCHFLLEVECWVVKVPSNPSGINLEQSCLQSAQNGDLVTELVDILGQILKCGVAALHCHVHVNWT